MKIDNTLLAHAHHMWQAMAEHFREANVPTDVLLHIAALSVLAECESRGLEDVISDVRDLAEELLGTEALFKSYMARGKTEQPS